MYSLAGITVSLNLVIDSTIVMTDHILHRRNLKAFMSVLAATLTTMGALVIIFFLDEKIRLNLQDFAAVVIINLAVSLFVALFFVPAMIEKISLVKKSSKKTLRHKNRRMVFRPYQWLQNAKQWMHPAYTYSQVDCLFYPFLSGAYSFSSPLAGGGVHCAVAGVRIAGLPSS